MKKEGEREEFGQTVKRRGLGEKRSISSCIDIQVEVSRRVRSNTIGEEAFQGWVTQTSVKEEKNAERRG